MRRITLVVVYVVILLIAIAIVGLMTLKIGSLREPGSFETWLASRAKHFVIRRNSQTGIPAPPASRQASIEECSKLFGAECAACHGIDGRAPTDAGRWMYPRAADLGSPVVRQYTNSELFWIVKNGIRFSGMPALGKVEYEHILNLVQYVRTLPNSAKTQ